MASQRGGLGKREPGGERHRDERVAQIVHSDPLTPVAVQPGGCSGLRYQLFFDERLVDGDKIFVFEDSDVFDGGDVLNGGDVFDDGDHHRVGGEEDTGHDSGYESASDE